MRNRIIFFSLFIILISCEAKKRAAETYEKISKQELLKQPLPVKLDLNSFEKKYDQFRVKIFSRTPATDTSTTDTIYRFYKKRTSFVFYKIEGGESYFLTASIKDDNVRLRGGIHVKQDKMQVYEQITGIPGQKSDTLRIDNSERQMIFIFDEKVLREIQINSYYRK